MGDRSPKDKQKKKQQHDRDHQQKEHAKVEKMNKNRHAPPEGQEQNEFKKAG